jgi:hypothetical protein
MSVDDTRFVLKAPLGHVQAHLYRLSAAQRAVFQVFCFDFTIEWVIGVPFSFISQRKRIGWRHGRLSGAGDGIRKSQAAEPLEPAIPAPSNQRIN